jgi:hypothetical protein
MMQNCNVYMGMCYGVVFFVEKYISCSKIQVFNVHYTFPKTYLGHRVGRNHFIN